MRIAIAPFLLLACGIAACSPQPGSEANGGDDARATRNPFADNAGGREGNVEPLVDHHVHAFSPAVRRWLEQELGLPSLPDLGVGALVEVLEEEGVSKAALLSTAYFFARSTATQQMDPEMLRAENDRTAQAVSRYPDRLVGFFGIDPLAESAFPEMERNAAGMAFAGVKLHLANSEVDLRDPAHVDRLGEVFARANALGLAIVIHLRTQHPEYGADDARTFLAEVLPRAPDVPVQIAHMGGWGGYDPATDSALGAVAQGLSRDDVYFDLSAVVRAARGGGDATGPEWWRERRYERLVERIRELGIHRVVFGTDWPEWSPESYRADLEENLPLTPTELQAIMTNRTPWLR